MNYWIFQSMPERYDLRDESNLFEGMNSWWRATRYRKKMSIDDIVYFWMGGGKVGKKVCGVYGVGKISSLPYQDDGIYKVDIEVTKRLNQFVGVNEIEQSKKLQDLMILNIAIGSNFLINESEGLALRKLTDRNL